MMTSEKTAYLENLLTVHKEKEKKNYLTVSQLLTKFGKTGLKQFDLSAKPSGKELESTLSPFLGTNLMFLKKASSLYLVFNMPLHELIFETFLEKINKGPFSPATLAQHLPMKKDEYVKAVNFLLETGRITVKINDKFIVSVQSVSGTPSASATPTASPIPSPQPTAPPQHTERELFKAAFDKLDRGRIYVRICYMRRELGWSEERFNALLRKLRADGTIQLHAGDVSTMTEEDVNQSYTDENNFFYATLTWKN